MESYIKEQLKLLIGSNNAIGIRDKYDVTILVISLILKKHEFKFTDTTIGNDKVVPDNWNSSTDSYTLDYVHDLAPNKQFHIKCLRMGDTLLVNAMIKDKNDKIHTLDVTVNNLVKNTEYTQVDDLLLNLKEFIQMFEFSIINPMVPGLVRIPTNLQQAASQQQQQQQTNVNRNNNNRRSDYEDHDDPLRIGEPQRGNQYREYLDQDPDLYPPGFPVFSNNPFYPPNRVFPGFGGSQVGRDHPGFGNVHNPYAGNNPYGQGLPGFEQRLPRGAVPPGARFDPFGPPTTGSNRGGRHSGMPDRDDFGPPGFDPPGFI